MLRIKDNLKELKEVLDETNGHWYYEDLMYRFYHHSYKVQWVKNQTKKILEVLKKLQDPDAGMDAQYLSIVEEGLSEVSDINKEWDKTRKWVEAFLHSKYFLEMVVKYGEELDKIPQLLPSGVAAILELYNVR